MYPIVSIIDKNSIIDGNPKELHVYADGTVEGNMHGYKIVNYGPLIKRRFQEFINELLESYYIPDAKGSVGSSGEPQETDENFDNISSQNGTDSGGK